MSTVEATLASGAHQRYTGEILTMAYVCRVQGWLRRFGIESRIIIERNDERNKVTLRWDRDGRAYIGEVKLVDALRRRTPKSNSASCSRNARSRDPWRDRDLH